MPDLFRRAYELTLIDKVVSDLECTFTVEKTKEADPNNAEIVVYNLSESTRKNLSEAENPVVRLEAGYEGDTSLLFLGKARSVTSQRQGPEWVTRLDVGDGAVEVRAAQTEIRFAPGTGVGTVIEQLAKKTGLSVGRLKETVEEKGLSAGLTEFVKGFTATGNAYNLVDQLCKSLGLQVSIQDGTLTAVEAVSGVSSTEAIRLNPSSGVLDSPELGNKGTVRVRTLLRASIRPNDPIILETKQAEGRYRVEKATHSGSYRGADWTSELELKPL